MTDHYTVPAGEISLPGGGDWTVLWVVVYGPPRSRWGRFKNQLRALIGLDRRDEVYFLIDKVESAREF